MILSEGNRRFVRQEAKQIADQLILDYIVNSSGGLQHVYVFDRKTHDNIPIMLREVLGGDLSRVRDLFSLLDDCIAFSERECGRNSVFAGFWVRFLKSNFEDANADAFQQSPKDPVTVNLGNVERILQFIFGMLGAEDYLDQRKKTKDYTLGKMLNDADLLNVLKDKNNGKGMFKNKKEIKLIFNEILAERNDAFHEGRATTDLRIECINRTALILVGLLHIVDYHFEELDSIVEEKGIPEVQVQGEGGRVEDYESLKRVFVERTLSETESALRRNVGMFGGVNNSKELKLMNLKMQLVRDDISLARHVAEGDEGENSVEQADYTLRTVAESQNRIHIFLGNPGAGKSTLLYHLQRDLCNRWLDGEIDAVIPIPVALRNVSHSNFTDAVQDAVGDDCFRAVKPLFEEGRAVFILDGLNEVSVKGFYDSLCEAIRTGYRKCRFYISGRIHEFSEIESKFKILDDCGIFYLREISLEDIDTYFKSINASESTQGNFHAWIDRMNLESLLTSPLNFSMIMRMVSNDYSAPGGRINNRGELLDVFLKSTLQDKGELTQNVDSSFAILQLLALRLEETGSQVVPLSQLLTAYPAFSRDMLSIDKEFHIKKILDEPIRLNVVQRTYDVNGEELYSFGIDTFQEYFLARDISVRFVGNPAMGSLGRSLSSCLPEGVKVFEARRFEMLRLVIELIAGGRIHGETMQQDSLRFVQEFLDQYQADLATLSGLVSAIPHDNEARKWVENRVLAEMRDYRDGHEIPALTVDQEILSTLIKGAVRLSTDDLYDELFNLYWMSVTGMTAYWEFGFPFGDCTSNLERNRMTLVSNCTDSLRFYDYFHRAAVDIMPLYPASSVSLNLTRNMLFSSLVTSRQKVLYQHILDNYWNGDRFGEYKDDLLYQDASLLLLYMDDTDYIYEKMDLRLMMKTGTRIGLHTLKRLLLNYMKPSTAKIVFRKGFFDLLKVEGKNSQESDRQWKYRIAMVIRYFLFRNCIPQELLDFLSPSKGNGLALLHENERLPILDLLPIADLRPFKDRYFDSDIFQFLDEHERGEEESVEGLHYRIYSIGEKRTRVWIRNVVTDFEGLYAEIGSTRLKIVRDERIVATQYRFKFTGNTIIDEAGVFTVAGQHIRYAVPVSGSEVIFTTFDAHLGELLSQSETVVVGQTQECRVTRTFKSQPRTWRVLTLEGEDRLPYYGDMRFLRDDCHCIIDKTIEAAGYRFEPLLFRRIQDLPTRECMDVHFDLLGCSGAKVWVVTDKLMNYDRYRGAYVRVDHDATVCRFVEAHPFSEGFVELSLRSSIPFDFPQNGTLSYRTSGNEEETVPYVFWTGVGTRNVLRITNEEFIRSISSPQNRMAYSEGVFRIGAVSLILDYVEVFQGSEHLSVWTLQRLTGGAFPQEGILEVAENADFKTVYQLTFSDETRSPSAEVENCNCIFRDRGNHQALFSVNEPISPIRAGLFLTNDESAAHLEILEKKKVKWIAQANGTPELTIPVQGLLTSVDSGMQVRYCIDKTEGSSASFVFFPEDDLDFDAFLNCWDSGKEFLFVPAVGSGIRSGFREKEALFQIREESILLKTDLPAGVDPVSIPSGDWYLSVFFPIRNEIEQFYDRVSEIIKVHSVPYTKLSETAIRIRKPDTELIGLWVRCGNSPARYQVLDVTSSTDNKLGIDFCSVQLMIPKGRRSELDINGIAQFFSGSSSTLAPVAVGYARVLQVVDLQNVRNLKRAIELTGAEDGFRYYPAQICDNLFEELSEVGYISQALVKFFIDHSRSYMLLGKRSLLEKVQHLEYDKPCFNLCTITEIDKEGGLVAFSWLNGKPFPSMDLDGHLSVGDLVIIERNHKVTPIGKNLIKGTAFPEYDVVPLSERRSYNHEPLDTTWKQETEYIARFNQERDGIVAFISQKETAQKLTVRLSERGFVTDPYGIKVICNEFPSLSFKLCGVSKSSYTALEKGESISVLPSGFACHSFKPYKFTPKGYVQVIDVSTVAPVRSSDYYCIVNGYVAKNQSENVVVVLLGNFVGTFIKEPGSVYRNGEMVLLRLMSKTVSENGVTWFKFSTSVDENVIRVRSLNLKPRDILRNIEIVKGGEDDSLIRVVYPVQGAEVSGTVDNNDIPSFSSRVLNGLYAPGTRLDLRVKAIMEASNSIQFELVDKTVSYPFEAGIYDCTVHLRPKSVFFWRLRDGVAAWATFFANDREYTVEIPQEEMLSVPGLVKESNVYDYLMSFGQRIPAQLVVTGFTDYGDPVIRLQSQNQRLLNDLPADCSFSARVLYADSGKHMALWSARNRSGMASFRIKPRIGSQVKVYATGVGEGRCFEIENDAVPNDTIAPGTELFAVYHRDEAFWDESLFIATELDPETGLPTGRRFLCRHDKGVLPLYWVEYLIRKGKPLNAMVNAYEGGVHHLSFLPVIDDYTGIQWRDDVIYEVSVVCVTRNQVIVSYSPNEGRTLLGAILADTIDPFFKSAPDFPRFRPGSKHQVRFVSWNPERHSVFFRLEDQFQDHYPYGLTEGQEIKCGVYHIGADGCAYVRVVGKDAVRVKLLPEFCDWSVLPSGKPIVKVGDILSCKVRLLSNAVLLRLPDSSNPWSSCHLSADYACTVTIGRVDHDDVMVKYGNLFGEIPTCEFAQSEEELVKGIGSTIQTRLALGDPSSHILCFTTIGAEDLQRKTKKLKRASVGDVITASVKGYVDHFTPLMDWEGCEFQITPYQAAVLARKPWLGEALDEMDALPIGSSYRLVVSEVDEGGKIISIKPSNLGSEAFGHNEVTPAVVLYCQQDGIYAETADDPEKACLVFIPKDELAWGKVYSALGYFSPGDRINVKKRPSVAKRHLITCSIKRISSAPGLKLITGDKVEVKVEKVLPHALNVLCEESLHLQIAFEDTTWNPSYLLGGRGKKANRFKVGASVSATVVEGGTDREIRLSLRDEVNPWRFGNLSAGDEWPASFVKVLDEEHFIASCRGLYVRVNNPHGLPLAAQSWVRIRILEVLPDEPSASADLLEVLPEDYKSIQKNQKVLDSELVPFSNGDRVSVRVTRIHHPLMIDDRNPYLEFSTVLEHVPGVIPSTELAWQPEQRRVDHYRVGDQVEVVVTGFIAEKGLVLASIREAESADSRTIQEIVDCGAQDETIIVSVVSIGEHYHEDSGVNHHYVNFTYGTYPGRVILNETRWSAIQDPDSFFWIGRKMRVKPNGSVDVAALSGGRSIMKTFLKAEIPFLQYANWDSLHIETGAVVEVGILSVQSEFIFVFLEERIVVKMDREQLMWEPTLPLKERFRVGGRIRVRVTELSVRERIVRLDTRSLRENPYAETVGIAIGDEYKGVIVCEESDCFFIDIPTKDDRVTGILPFTEFLHPWHRKYKKGDIVSVIVSSIDRDRREILVTRKAERFSNDELLFEKGRYYWFDVQEYVEEGILLARSGYQVLLRWKDAWMGYVSDPSDMYPVGLECLLKVKAIEGATIEVAADFDWGPGLRSVTPGSSFKAEVCLRNPYNGIVVRVMDTEDEFCLVTRTQFPYPLASSILSFPPRSVQPVYALDSKKLNKSASDKVYGRFQVSRIWAPEEEYKRLLPGLVVRGRVTRESGQFLVVQHNGNIHILVDRSFAPTDVKVGDHLVVRITQHEQFVDNRGRFVSLKLVGSAFAVKNDPLLGLPIGKRVIGRVSSEGSYYSLRVDLPQKGTVTGDLFVPQEFGPVYPGQKVTAFVSYHDYENREVRFTLDRTRIERLQVGTLLDATVVDVIRDPENQAPARVRVNIPALHYQYEIPQAYMFWGGSIRTPIVKAGDRFTVALSRFDRKTDKPVAFTRRALFPDFRQLTGQIVRGRIVAQSQDGCLVLAGATLGILPISEMSYQPCTLWQKKFLLGQSYDFMVCAEDEAFPELAVYSHCRTFKNPFASPFNKKAFCGALHMGTIVRSVSEQAVVCLDDGTDVVIPKKNMQAFSDGFKVVIPENGTKVCIRITDMRHDAFGRWYIEGAVVPNKR